MSVELRIAYLLPDTNFFEQCKDPSTLNWSPWNDYDGIHIVVTRPVQEEIDEHKKKGNERIARRARKASILFRKIIAGDRGYQLAEKDGQTIKILLAQHKPDKDLQDQLDYTEFDNALVGAVAAFAKEKGPTAYVRLLTHDTGPMMSAKAVGVPFYEIPEEWLLDPEPSPEARKIAQLEERVQRLETLEPELRLTFLDENGQKVDDSHVMEFRMNRWLPLTKEELAALKSRIQARHPMATNFEGVKTEDILAAERTSFLRVEHIPADDEDIESYRREEYPSWLKQCESILEGYHFLVQTQEGYPTCTLVARNVGARPAEDVLIRFEAKGDFRLARPKWAEALKSKEPISLPDPPEPPM